MPRRHSSPEITTEPGSVFVPVPHHWAPRSYQKPTWDYIVQDKPGLRAIDVWHRRAGKDLLAINLCVYKAMARVGTYWHLLPEYKQGRAIVWNGTTKDGRRFLDFIPKKIIHRVLENEMRIHFVNDSIYQVVGTDNINALVGTNPVGCVFSEFSLHDPAVLDYVRPILRENGGWALFIFTPRGRNHAYSLLKMARREGWLVDIRKAGSGPDRTKRDGLVWKKNAKGVWENVAEDGLPVVTDEDIEKDRREGMADELIEQEYFLSFDAALTGAYYAKQLAKCREQGRVTNVPYNPQLPVDTVWDIGSDSTVVLFMQRHHHEIRIIDVHQASGEYLPHAIKVVKSKEYVYGSHFGPWDIEVHEFSSGRTRLEVARSLGINFRTTPQHDVADGIEQVREIFGSVWFDATHCERLLDALGSYRKEALAEQHQPPPGEERVFRDKPVHDWSSHYADAFRYLAWNVKKLGWRRQFSMPRQAEDNYKYV